MVNTIESFAEVYKCAQDSCGRLTTLIEVPVDEVKHLYQIMVDRATWQAPKLIYVDVRLDEQPDPFNEEPLEALTKEWCKT